MVEIARSMAGVGGTTPACRQQRSAASFPSPLLKLTVVAHEADPQLFVLRFDFLVFSPGDRVDGMVVVPRLHSDNSFSEIGEIVQSTGHRAEDTGNTFLASHAGVDSNLGPTASTTAEGVDAAPSRGNANRASNIRPDTDATTKSQQSTFTTRRASRGVFRDVWVKAMTPESICRFERQKRHGQRRFGIWDGT